jgi:hypothetical protein
VTDGVNHLPSDMELVIYASDGQEKSSLRYIEFSDVNPSVIDRAIWRDTELTVQSFSTPARLDIRWHWHI